jgi:hypothetical protein
MKDMGPDMVSSLYELRFVSVPRCLYLVFLKGGEWSEVGKSILCVGKQQVGVAAFKNI